MKVIIEDLVAKHEGKAEKELPEGATIRFEIGNTRLSCTITEEGLKIYKVNDFGLEGRIVIMAISSNELIIK